jgi:hypothetical protein
MESELDLRCLRIFAGRAARLDRKSTIPVVRLCKNTQSQFDSETANGMINQTVLQSIPVSAAARKCSVASRPGPKYGECGTNRTGWADFT